jgi:hypothetical protein
MYQELVYEMVLTVGFTVFGLSSSPIVYKMERELAESIGLAVGISLPCNAGTEDGHPQRRTFSWCTRRILSGRSAWRLDGTRVAIRRIAGEFTHVFIGFAYSVCLVCSVEHRRCRLEQSCQSQPLAK